MSARPMSFMREKVETMYKPALEMSRAGLIPNGHLESGAMEIASLLVEGGSRVLASAFQAGIVDKVQFFYAPKVLGGDDGIPICSGPGPELMNQSVPIKDISVQRFDDDILIEGYVEKP